MLFIAGLLDLGSCTLNCSGAKGCLVTASSECATKQAALGEGISVMRLPGIAGQFRFSVLPICDIPGSLMQIVSGFMAYSNSLPPDVHQWPLSVWLLNRQQCCCMAVQEWYLHEAFGRAGGIVLVVKFSSYSALVDASFCYVQRLKCRSWWDTSLLCIGSCLNTKKL